MPGVFQRPVTRKAFLTTSARACGALLLAPAGRVWAGAPGGPAPPLRVAMLSDTHIPADAQDEYRGFHMVDNLRRVVDQVADASPQVVMLNGDAARLSGEPEDYTALQSLLKPLAERSPVCIGLGNHDNRTHFWKTFPPSPSLRQPVAQKHVLVYQSPQVRIIQLDSLLYVNRVAGLLGKAQRTWLADYLPRAADRPTVLMVHHTLGDGDGDLLDVDRLYQIVRDQPHVKAIFYGHSHCWSIGRRDRLVLVNLPAVGYNFSDDQPVGWVDARFDAGGVSLTLRAIGGHRAADGQTESIRWA